MEQPIKVFIVDDHPMIKEGLSAYLKDCDRFQLVGTATNGVEAFEKLKAVDADIVLTDIQMPRMNGIELTELLLEKNPDQKIVVLSMFGEIAYIKKLLQLGVMGYILKDIGKVDLQKALEQVAAGENYYSKEVTEVMMNKLRGANQKSFNIITDLTEREREILHLILMQKSNQEIADELFISPRTVEAHKRNMLSKTSSKNLAGLVIFAIENQVFTDFN